jgi:ATP-dependent helicase IRC3
MILPEAIAPSQALFLDGSGPLALRPYQCEALEAIRSSHARGVTCQLVALPTGTGKTVIFSHLIHERGGRALVLAHRDELIEQAVEKLLLVNPAMDVGVVKAERDEHDAAVVVASMQTLSRPNRLQRLTPNFRTVIVDEAHHSTAATYRRVLDYVGAYAADGPLTVGVTATPERADGEALGAVWQELVYSKSLLEMIRAGYLVDLRALQVQLEADFKALRTSQGDFVEDELADLLLAANAPELVAQAFRQYASGRKTLVFTPAVVLARATAEALQRTGIATEALDATTPAAKRRAILDRFHTGETLVVVNCGVLTEGYDEPSIECVVIARPTQSRPFYVQMLGRGTRPYPGKRDCLIIDIVGATTRHDVVTLPMLLKLTPASLVGRTVGEVTAARQQFHARDAAVPATGRLVAIPVDLFRRRRLHWVAVRGDCFVLPLGRGWVALEGREDRWDVAVVSPSGARTRLASKLSLGYAQGCAEDYARSLGAGGLVNPRARWREDPASEGQRRFLRGLGIAAGSDLTKGAAADLITIARVQHAGRQGGWAHG